MDAMPKPEDTRAGLARALAETDLECQSAEHDLRRLLNEGADHMNSRYPTDTLGQRPGDLDHWAFHKQSQAQTQEEHGIGAIPDLPFHPTQGT